VDCAVAGNADFIVTNDGHFKVLKDIQFPRVEVLSIDEFEQLLIERRKIGT
jgi:predicted nucleic acid-binding protein